MDIKNYLVEGVLRPLLDNTDNLDGLCDIIEELTRSVADAPKRTAIVDLRRSNDEIVAVDLRHVAVFDVVEISGVHTWELTSAAGVVLVRVPSNQTNDTILAAYLLR